MYAKQFCCVVDRAYAFVRLKAEVSTKKDSIVNPGRKLLFPCRLYYALCSCCC